MKHIELPLCRKWPDHAFMLIIVFTHLVCWIVSMHISKICNSINAHLFKATLFPLLHESFHSQLVLCGAFGPHHNFPLFL